MKDSRFSQLSKSSRVKTVEGGARRRILNSRGGGGIDTGPIRSPSIEPVRQNQGSRLQAGRKGSIMAQEFGLEAGDRNHIAS